MIHGQIQGSFDSTEPLWVPKNMLESLQKRYFFKVHFPRVERFYPYFTFSYIE